MPCDAVRCRAKQLCGPPPRAGWMPQGKAVERSELKGCACVCVCLCVSVCVCVCGCVCLRACGWVGGWVCLEDHADDERRNIRQQTQLLPMPPETHRGSHASKQINRNKHTGTDTDTDTDTQTRTDKNTPSHTQTRTSPPVRQGSTLPRARRQLAATNARRLSPVPVQMWPGVRPVSRCRCGQGCAQSRCRCGSGE